MSRYLSPSKIALQAVLCVAILVATAGSAFAQDRISSSEAGREAIARFLMNFGRFIDWPDSAFSGEQFNVCVLGENQIGRELESTIIGRSAGDRDFAIEELGSGDPINGCQIVYVSNSEEQRVGEIIQAVDGRAVLTVAELEEFPENGGMIGLAHGAREGDVAIRMRRNLIEDSGLQVREQLMRAIR